MRAFVLLAALMLFSACGTHGVTADSKSNWLRLCSAQNDCGPDLDCACGVCSKRCASASACGVHAGNVAVCVDPIEQGLPASCQLKPSAAAPGVCLQSCLESSQCGERQHCTRGVCVAETSSDASTPMSSSMDMDAAVADAAISDAATIDASHAGPIDAGRSGSALDASVQTGQAAPTIDVDCRPGHDIVREFGSRCQYLGADLPEISCPDLGPSPVGSINLTVHHAERITIGQPVVLDGADPDVTIDVALANAQVLVETYPGAPVSGMLIFDELRVGEILRGRFVDFRFSAKPDPASDCQIGNASFLADWGPGVRDQ